MLRHLPAPRRPAAIVCARTYRDRPLNARPVSKRENFVPKMKKNEAAARCYFGRHDKNFFSEQGFRGNAVADLGPARFGMFFVIVLLLLLAAKRLASGMSATHDQRAQEFARSNFLFRRIFLAQQARRYGAASLFACGYKRFCFSACVFATRNKRKDDVFRSIEVFPHCGARPQSRAGADPARRKMDAGQRDRRCLRFCPRLRHLRPADGDMQADAERQGRRHSGSAH